MGEFGVFGVCLWRQKYAADHAEAMGDEGRGEKMDGMESRETESNRIEILENSEAGYVLRTKGRQSEEGGIAAGFGCVDSCFLVDV